MSADYRTPAGSLVLATILVLTAAVTLFVTASVLGNEILRYYLFGAAAASLGCAMFLFAASKLYRVCDRAAIAGS